MNPTVDVICHAINERKLLKFRYHSLPRIVEPMCVGEVRPGVWQLRAHQTGGKSTSSLHLPDGKPRMFELANMIEVSILPQNFEIPVFYMPNDKGFKQIITQL
jgi:predicted DNA-binding transcriptional regulator YafY